MISNLLNTLWQYFLNLNLFKNSSSDEQTLLKERLATRFYVCSLVVLILIIAIVSACIVRTIEKIEYAPSQTKFSQLVNDHPSTLHCPCSKYGISYNIFVKIQVNFHVVCSSQFIQQTWIDLIFNQQNMLSLSSDDFRKTLSFFWQVINGFCIMSNRTWSDTVASFYASRILSPTAAAEEVVRNQVQAALNNYITLAQAEVTRSLLAIRRVISGNQIISALATNFYLHYSSTDLNSSESPKMSPRIFNNCSCLNVEGCPHPATFNNNYNHSVTVPGMIADCLIIDGALASTLECYYNQTCISLLHQSLAIDVKPLVYTANKYFMINSTVQTLLNKMMIDKVINDIRFDLYYSQCNPVYCAYSYTRHFDVLFIVTTIIGIFGSLSFALRLIAPFIATIILRWKNRHVLNNNVEHAVPMQQNQSLMSVTMNHLRLLPNYIWQKIVSLNIFEKQTERTPTNIFRERLLTRLFILMLTISSIVTGFYIYFVKQNQVVTVSFPSVATYQQLYNDHSATLQCPCSQISISYEKFLNVTYILHQVCTSDFVSPMWLNYLASFDPNLIPSWTETSFSRDFRTIGASYFQFLATFCSLSQNNINDALNVFMNTRFINDRVLAPPLFIQQTQSMIKSFIDLTKNDFTRILDWVYMTFTTNYFLIGKNINFLVTVTDDNQVTVENIIFSITSEITHNSIFLAGPCSCEVDGWVCNMLSLLYTNGTDLLNFQQNFEELHINCVLLLGFSLGKIGWWYNRTYLENIQATYSIIIDSQILPNIKPLNASLPTRFGNIILLDLFYEMLVETWIRNGTYFDKFYYECAPFSCSYTIVRRRDIIVVALLLISVCDGINQILQIFVPFIGKSIFFCIDRWKNRNALHALHSINVRLKRLSKLIYRSIIDINLFETTLTDEMNIRQQRIYTRVYLILYVGTLSILLFYTAFVERSITKTYLKPSITDYEHLLDLYSDGLNCPCMRISIPYNEFVTELRVNTFHQICTTDVIYTVLLSDYFTTYGERYPNEQDFRWLMSTFVKSLKQLCTLAKESVNNSIVAFQVSTMLVNQIMSRNQFNNEMNETINRFQNKIPITFARTLDFIRTFIQGNALMAAFSSNWKFVMIETGRGKNAFFQTVPVTHNNTKQNTTCSCATLRTCTTSARLFDNDGNLYYTFKGIVYGCYLLETVLLSSFSCFYSEICIQELRQALSELSYDTQYDIDPSIKLNSSFTRFNIDDTVETLAYEMFIESWIYNVSYEKFFNSCASNYCTYTYHYRFDAFELFTTFLSIFAGLSSGIRFIVPYLIKIIKKIRNRFRIRIVPLQ